MDLGFNLGGSIIYHVSRCVVAEEGVLAHEQADEENVCLVVDSHAVVRVEVGEDELHARSLLGDRWNQDHQDKDTYIHIACTIHATNKACIGDLE